MKINPLILGAMAMSLALPGCKDVTVTGPSAKGPYSMCRYTKDLPSDGHWSARISYPCETGDGPFPAVTVTGGFTNVKEQMYWMSNHLTEHGFIVITMTPNNPFGFNPVFERAHKSGYEQILAQNEDGDSPIFNLVDTANIGLLGYSYGGAGALLAANELGDRVQSVVGLAPVFTAPVELSHVNAPNLVLGGVNDTVLGPPAAMDLIYNAMPPDLQSMQIILNGVGHTDFVEPGNYHNLMKSYVVSWLTLTLKHDEVYLPYINGSKHQEYATDGRIFRAEFDL